MMVGWVLLLSAVVAADISSTDTICPHLQSDIMAEVYVPLFRKEINYIYGTPVV